jgi:hypothetical protein
MPSGLWWPRRASVVCSREPSQVNGLGCGTARGWGLAVLRDALCVGGLGNTNIWWAADLGTVVTAPPPHAHTRTHTTTTPGSPNHRCLQTHEASSMSIPAASRIERPTQSCSLCLMEAPASSSSTHHQEQGVGGFAQNLGLHHNRHHPPPSASLFSLFSLTLSLTHTHTHTHTHTPTHTHSHRWPVQVRWQ